MDENKLTEDGIGKFSALPKTCWVLSPGMPQFTVFGNLKYICQTFL